MENSNRPPGKTTVAPEALLTIVRLTALEVPGVSRLGEIPGGVNRFLKRRYGEGVRIDIEDDRIFTDVYVVIKNDFNVREVSRNIQNEIARAFSDLVGMQIGKINIHIEDIDFSEADSG